jgi:hypothetical protein
MALVNENRKEPMERIEHAEEANDAVSQEKDAAMDAATKGQATTGYETLSLLQTALTFKFSTLVCFAAAFSAATDGYQIGLVSVISAPKY